MTANGFFIIVLPPKGKLRHACRVTGVSTEQVGRTICGKDMGGWFIEVEPGPRHAKDCGACADGIKTP